MKRSYIIREVTKLTSRPKPTSVILAIFTFFVSIFSSNFVSAENIDYSVSVEPALTISVTSGGVATNSIVLDLNPLTHTFDSKSIDVSIATNNPTGYQLFMSTVNSKTTLDRDNSDGLGADTINTLPTEAGGYTEETFVANAWGYKVTSSDTDSSIVTSNYFPFILNNNISTNHSTTDGDNTTIEFAAKIDMEQAAGSYKNTLVFSAVATYAAYTIEYYDGLNNTVGSEIAKQENSQNTSATIKLNPGINPIRTTYSFAGWCDEVPVSDTNDYFPATVCNGNNYQTGDSISIDATKYETDLKLYAYWKPTTFEEAYQANGKSTYGTTGLYTMQDMSKDICAAVTINEVTQLKDTRENGTYNYYVAKLKDGKCWMTQNLRLGTTTSSLTLTKEDSNVSANYTLNGKRSDGVMPYTSITDDRYTGNNHNSIPYDGNAYYCAPSNSYASCYYNWFTATAGSGTSAVTPGASGYKDVGSSICPSNWYLPTGGGSDRPGSDFNVLFDNYNSAADMLVPGTTTVDNTTGLPGPGLLLSGNCTSTGANIQGTAGIYWSRSAWSKGIAYNLRLTSSGVDPQHTNHKAYGMSVRCLAYST